MFATASSASAPRLTRRRHCPATELTLWDGVLRLSMARVHELCGMARRTLAMKIAAVAGAPVIWITTKHTAVELAPAGIAPILPPQSLLIMTPERTADALWTMEEALKNGGAPLVVADLTDPPGMTPVRRLHLAAETGAATGLCKPTGLLLTPDAGGAQGIETRWRFDPDPYPGQDAWRIDRLRARMAPPQSWRIQNDQTQLLIS